MKLGQILDVFENRYSERALREVSWGEYSKKVRDREKIICTIWKDVIVPAVARILVHNNETMTDHQKIGLYYYLDFYSSYENDTLGILATAISLHNEAKLRQFDAMIKEHLLCNEKYIGHIVIGSEKITTLYRLKDNSEKLNEKLQEPYEKKLKNLMSQLRETVVYDPQILKKLKDIEGIEPYLT